MVTGLYEWFQLRAVGVEQKELTIAGLTDQGKLPEALGAQLGLEEVGLSWLERKEDDTSHQT